MPPGSVPGPSAAPVPLPAPERWSAVGDGDAYTRVRVAGRWLPVRPAFVQATTALGPGFWVLGAVRSGRLRPGERLPATRSLAADLGVSRTTVAAAYDRLVAEGLLTARVGHEVPVGYIAGGEPRVASVVASTGVRGPRVVLATWLLAPGAFHRWLADAGADVVAEPLGDHPDVVGVVVERYRAAA